MDQKTGPETTGLENQLRGMILGNVRIGDSQASPEAQHTQRGRGRGRGGPWRGNHRGGYQQSPSQEQQPRGGGAGGFNNRGRYRQYAPPTPHVPQAPSIPQRGAHPPRVLQRPHSNNPAQGHGPSVAPHLRQQAPHQPRPQVTQPRENPMTQVEHLEMLAAEEIPKVEMGLDEFEGKEVFRQRLEGILRQAFDESYSGDIATISLVGFGSLASGFGMPGSDMDLAVVPGWKDSSQADRIGIDREIPRLLERAVLDAKMGGRLLTRTRVPILKVCESPTDELYSALFEERKKWDELPDEEQYPTDAPVKPSPSLKPLVDVGEQKPADIVQHADSPAFGESFPALGAASSTKKKAGSKSPTNVGTTHTKSPTTPTEATSDVNSTANASDKQQHNHRRNDKTWVREKVLGPLDFPKQGVGIQCDINFENPLGIHNTHMLRCYSLTDPRVRPMVLFVKSWAKRRKINSAYSGTLNSYGWVLMVLHYLVNIAQPPVCPNLQHSIPPPKDISQLENFFKGPTVGGYTVRFWRNEQEIIQAAQAGQLSQNKQNVGGLLRGFFQYYASISGYSNNYGPRPPQFYWTNEVLSLRTLGGIRTKQDKGWVSAKTTITAEKKVTNRYLFAIEDPFELDHNVARTVTHRGIVAIRDEFRRAWRIMGAIGKGMQPEGGIFDEVIEDLPPKEELEKDVKKMGMEDVGVNDGTAGVQHTENTGGL
ncbi:PAP/OAS1 substrate-binding domain-containing protein [Ophiobolus disseminans]|uniref:polynucleotide adenylyltransferase n=1 Tax=Ophiobolus disseminans TaxID=1469910 RepID=A0A6A7A5J6_9PLEO|nr:PAP/OAS1 substrate-binding domain-containing protein [Ophiobolus disseminans]